VRFAALARLGTIGTSESLAAAERIEAKGSDIVGATSAMKASSWTYPLWHFSDQPPVAIGQAQSEDGTVYKLIFSNLLGCEEPLLTSSRTPEDADSWSYPMILPFAPSPRWDYARTRPRLELAGIHGGKLELAVDGKPLEFSMADVMRDSDGDGLTDLDEARLGLDPRKSDSDEDGVADGLDCCPNYAQATDDASDPVAEPLQRAIFAAYGLSDSCMALLADLDARRVQIRGYGGPIIYGIKREAWTAAHGRGGIFVNWTVKIDGEHASVFLNDFEGEQGGSTQEILLEMKNGRWYVTGRGMMAVS
jgi:hypothetical protein